jgi:hypothetical protein
MQARRWIRIAGLPVPATLSEGAARHPEGKGNRPADARAPIAAGRDRRVTKVCHRRSEQTASPSGCRFFPLLRVQRRSAIGPMLGWGGRIRTSAWRNQNPLPYRLATPQQQLKTDARGTILAGSGTRNPQGEVEVCGPERLISQRGFAQRELTMPGAKSALRLALLGLMAFWMPAAIAASFDCNSRWLTRTEITICDDVHLSRMDDRLARRLSVVARRLNFGQYLGLRHWHASSARQRSQCGTDRGCIIASYRAQERFLDQLQYCVDASLSRRTCLRELVGVGDRETMRR